MSVTRGSRDSFRALCRHKNDYPDAPRLQTLPLAPRSACNPVFDTANNRIKMTAAGQGDYRYDAAGNLLCEPGRLCVQGQSGLEPYYAYDAENKMKSVGGGSEGGGTTLKLLYLALQNIAWKWMMPIKEWKAALNRFAIIFEDRMPAL